LPDEFNYRGKTHCLISNTKRIKKAFKNKFCFLMFFNNKEWGINYLLFKKFSIDGMIEIGVIGQFDKYLQMLNF
jgi:hypothetical protein